MTLDLADGFAVVALAFLSCFLRVGTFFLLAPGLGEVMLPRRLRLAIALAFTSIIFPGLFAEVDEFSLQWVMIEPIIGAFLGLLLRTFVFSLRIAGAIASQAVSLSQFMGSPSSEPSTTISEFLTLGGISILFALGLPVQIFHFLDLSYGIFPMSGSMLLALNTEFLIGHYDYIMKQALVLAMPFLILSLLYNVALGVINKAMPQLMVMLVGAPAITGLGLLLLASVSIALLSNWSRTFTEFLSLSSVGGL